MFKKVLLAKRIAVFVLAGMMTVGIAACVTGCNNSLAVPEKTDSIEGKTEEENSQKENIQVVSTAPGVTMSEAVATGNEADFVIED